ncbi:MAG TPA: hypothetical protein VFG21_02510 [Xanthomonadaceae bacterium]|nr:hypothetical protein [Xanthomonadaceae bacterium]
MSIRTAHPPGHFYSPIVDPRVAEDSRSRIWPATPEIHGIDFQDDSLWIGRI